MQQTLAQPFTLTGLALHSGLRTKVTVSPAPVDHGRQFRQGAAHLPALVDWVKPSALSTGLSGEHFSVRTPEHLLAALIGMGIDNCLIELEGAELPILDGSALPYVRAIEQVGLQIQDQRARVLVITQPVTVHDGDRFVAAFPDTCLRLTYGIDFPGTAIGVQWTSWVITPATFSLELAGARTFTTLAQIKILQSLGLIQGGSLECALVADTTTWVGQQPQWPDEAARHKTLDLLGDLALTGATVQAHVVAYKAGHELHGQLARRLRYLLLDHHE